MEKRSHFFQLSSDFCFQGIDKAKEITILREEGEQGILDQKIVEYLIEMIGYVN